MALMVALGGAAAAAPGAPAPSTAARTPGAAPRTDDPHADMPEATYAFTFDTLLAEAKRRASVPYALQRSTLPAGLDK